jgi:hypothetical protein
VESFRRQGKPEPAGQPKKQPLDKKLKNRNVRIKEVKMEIQVVIALAVAIPIILFPAAFVWYLNIGGVMQTVREARARNAAQKVTTK